MNEVNEELKLILSLYEVSFFEGHNFEIVDKNDVNIYQERIDEILSKIIELKPLAKERGYNTLLSVMNEMEYLFKMVS